MASQEFLKLLNNFEEKPSGTLREWQRVLNHILDNLSNGSYVTTDATNVTIDDAAKLDWIEADRPVLEILRDKYKHVFI
jgi:hypothetical protein